MADPLSISTALAHVEKVIAERAERHGEDPVAQLLHAQQIKRAIGHRTSETLTLTEIEAIDNIAQRLSRLTDGTPSISAWEDLVGYAIIAMVARSMVQSEK